MSEVVEIGYKPNAWQDKVHRSVTQNLTLCGGLGSGKSLCAIRELQACALQNDGGLYLIGRKTLPSLRDTTYRTFFEHVEPELIKEHNKANLTVKLVNGSEFIFRPLDDEEKLKSLQISGFFVDEANEIEESMYLTLQSRVRQIIKGREPFYRTILALNPTDEDHWIPQKFLYQKPKNHEIHFSTTMDNRANLPKDYIDNLMSSYTPDMQQRMIYGQFGRVHKGRPVFPSFSKSIHVRPFEVDRNFPLIRGWDFGYNNPAVVWLQFVNGQIRILGSVRGNRIYLDDFYNQKIVSWEKEIFGEWKGARQDFCDPHGSDKSDKKETSVQILNSFGIYPAHRRTTIAEGLRGIKNFLDSATNTVPDLIVHPRATSMIEGFVGGYCRLDGEENPDKTTGFDHEFDAFRYAVVHIFNRHRMNNFNRVMSEQRVIFSKTGGRRIEV